MIERVVGSFHSRKFTAFRFRKISTQWELKFWSHSDTSFYAKVDKDLTFINQNIVKNTANDLRAKQEFPTTAKNLTITTPRTSCIYFLPKIHKPNNPGRPHRLCLQLSHRIYFQLFRQNYGIYRQKFTIIHQRQPTFAIFSEFNIIPFAITFAENNWKSFQNYYFLNNLKTFFRPIFY